MNEPQAQMPQYQCHKKVWALKIREVILDTDLAQQENRETTGRATIVPEDTRFAPFEADVEYVCNHNPQAGGYYVVYEDGYKSWSPAEAFESGYTIIENNL